MKKLIVLLVSVLLTVSMTTIASAEGQNGTTLSASVTLTTEYTRTYNWSINKTVSPSTLNLFEGDQAAADYTVSVNKTGYTDKSVFPGMVSVINGGAVPTEGLAITVILSTTGNNSQELTSVPVDVSDKPVLAPGETYSYEYTINYTGTPGTTYKVTANITITNHSGSLDVPFGPSPSVSAVFPESPREIYSSITVNDTYAGSGAPWTFNDSGSITYSRTFTSEDAGINNNTATILETGQSASAQVTINCYSLQVNKSANTTFSRSWSWTIDKTADQTALTLALNQVFPVNYQVAVNAVSHDGDWAANGTITIHNPAPIAAVINSVTDIISGITPNVDYGSTTFPYILAPGGTFTLNYTVSLPDASYRTNTATAQLQNYLYNTDGTKIALGTTDFDGTADITFGQTPTVETDEIVTVSDSLQGNLGMVNANTGIPTTFAYTRNVGPYTASGNYSIDNTATLITNDTGTSISDSWTVAINIPSSGCTLTIGYWKTHAGFGPQDNMVHNLLPIWLGTEGGAKSVQITSEDAAVTYLSMKGDASNGINKLYAQLLAAKLNIKNGADISAVKDVIANADAFLAAHNSSDWSSLSKADKNKVLSWANTLDQYNNGIIGPGHASEQ